MIVGAEDEICPLESAMEIAETIGDNVVNFTTIEGVGHNYFAWSNPDWLIDLVKSQLSVETVKIESCNEKDGCEEAEEHYMNWKEDWDMIMGGASTLLASSILPLAILHTL